VEKGLDEAKLQWLLTAGRQLVSDLDLERVLGRVLEAAMEVTGARYAALGVLDESRSGLENFIHRGIDDATRAEIGDLPQGRGVLGLLISNPEPLRLPDVGSHPASAGFPPGHPPLGRFLGVPITSRGERWGNLYLTEKRGEPEFSAGDAEAALLLADWAAVAIGNARSVAADRLRLAMEAAEQERLQWARELHDQTLQGLAAIRMMLATGRRRGGDHLGDAIESSVEQLDAEISAVRALISDLRPDSLDRLGIGAALEGLVERMLARDPEVEIEIAPRDRLPQLPKSTEVAIYRVIQEAMTNAIRHGQAGRIVVSLERNGASVAAAVEDDGIGFVRDSATLGYGI
jgi:signal transduction histidine kinase